MILVTLIKVKGATLFHRTDRIKSTHQFMKQATRSDYQHIKISTVLHGEVEGM